MNAIITLYLFSGEKSYLEAPPKITLRMLDPGDGENYYYYYSYDKTGRKQNQHLPTPSCDCVFVHFGFVAIESLE